MIIALYLPDEIAEQFKVDHLQATLHRLRRLSEKLHRIGTEVDGECLLYTDVKFMRQLEASFCVSREIVKSNGAVPLVGPSFPESEWELKNSKESI